MKQVFMACGTILISMGLSAQTNGDSTLLEEDDKKALKISGSADVYYKYDFADTRENSLTSFTQSHNQFALGMASVKLDYTLKNVNMVADLGFGQRARDFAYADDGIIQAIKQLYISYSPAEKLKFTAGTWATHLGYEVLDPQYNRNYSMSYLFTNGPFSHTGLKAEYALGKHGFMVGVSNVTDYRIVPDGKLNRKFLLGQYSFAPSDNFKLFLNYAGGKFIDTSRTDQLDLVATATLNKEWSLAVNGSFASVCLWNSSLQENAKGKPWWGTALYINYDPVEWFGIAWRSELFNDHNHLKSLGNATDGDHIFSNTLTANFKKAGFTIMPELRWDHVNKKAVFTDDDHRPTSNDLCLLIAAVYSF